MSDPQRMPFWVRVFKGRSPILHASGPYETRDQALDAAVAWLRGRNPEWSRRHYRMTLETGCGAEGGYSDIRFDTATRNPNHDWEVVP